MTRPNTTCTGNTTKGRALGELYHARTRVVARLGLSMVYQNNNQYPKKNGEYGWIIAGGGDQLRRGHSSRCMTTCKTSAGRLRESGDSEGRPNHLGATRLRACARAGASSRVRDPSLSAGKLHTRSVDSVDFRRDGHLQSMGNKKGIHIHVGRWGRFYMDTPMALQTSSKS